LSGHNGDLLALSPNLPQDDRIDRAAENRQEIPVNMLLLSHLSAISGIRYFFRNALFLVCSVLLLTHMFPTQDSSGSKIPDGEAQFTQEQLQEYYLIYKNPDVRYLRTLFDVYLKNS